MITLHHLILSAIILSLTPNFNVLAILYPQDSEKRETKSLDGLWSFVLEPPNSIGYGFLAKWWKLDLSLMENATVMPVPSSYNDIDAKIELRDHVGWAWYQRTFHVPESWKASRTVIRFGSVNYYGLVWINGKLATAHTGGHLPFEAELNDFINFDKPNVITVAVNNTLSQSTIPPGEFQYKQANAMYPEGYFTQTPDFDFFNYAGIQRSVVLYRTSKIFIEDINVKTDINQDNYNGFVAYTVSVGGTEANADAFNVSLTIKDRVDRVVGTKNLIAGRFEISNAQFWWPRGMNQSVGYLYTLTVDVLVGNQLIDRYSLQVGIRNLAIVHSDGSFRINGVPFYFKGCGMHEDSDIRGRGFDYGVMTKDLNLLEWMGANSFRTSHYPYSEERMMECDRRGIVVIAETPAVGVRYFTAENLQLHKTMLTELIARDKNHASVVMWSISNEPRTEMNASRAYFKELIDLARKMDNTRPVTIVYGPTDFNNDKTADFVDVLSINRYYGWYSNMGHLEIIFRQMTQDLTDWRQTFIKPVLVTEYGADSMVGLYTEPPTDFSESYQVALMKENHRAFDLLKAKKFLIGEMFWNFADFMTAQGTTRAVGNRKGVFTRNRQPKMAAYLMKNRYTALSSLADQSFAIQTTGDYDFI
jgi:beta-glucuronidase